MRSYRIRPFTRGLLMLALISSALGASLIHLVVPATAQGGERTGLTRTVQGSEITTAEIVAKSAQAGTVTGPVRQRSPRHVLPRPGGNNAVTSASVPAAGAVEQSVAGPRAPQTVIDQFQGPGIVDSGFVPPDTMGTVGPSQFFVAINGRFRVYAKNSPHTVQLDMTDTAFWSGVANAAGVSDPHVRYDRVTQRWFITEIDIPNTDNNILVAVSDSATISGATIWKRYALPATGATPALDNGCFADYDTPGIDQNAIYIGANMFCPTNYAHSNVYVVNKASVLTGPATYTSFFNVTNGVAGPGPSTPQGVDDYDSLPVGFFIGPNVAGTPITTLQVLVVNTPGGTPTLTGPIAITMPNPENGTIGGVTVPNAPTPLDDLDDRLFAAVIRNSHLWTAHNVAVDSTGNSNAVTRNRDAVRWYDITVSGGTPTINQSGTIFDSSASGFFNFWMGTVMVSGQGHAAFGMSRANSATSPQDVTLGRLANDPAGTTQAFFNFQNSAANAYNDGGNPQRWGDYSYTSLDPCDDMTMWTIQEFIKDGTFGAGWAVEAARLQAPAPAVLPGGPIANVLIGQASVILPVSGSSPAGQGFYDTPNTITDPCRTRLTAAVNHGVTVTSVTYTDPTHISLNLNTTVATTGLATVTITNPDGQLVTTTIQLIGSATNTPTSTRTTSPTNTLTATSTSTPTPIPGVPVSIMNFAFVPTPLTIQVGTTVTWTNMDNTTHTTTSDTGVWDSGNLTHLQTFSFTFTAVGTYNYHCNIHTSMHGTIIVVSGTLTPTPTSTSTLTPTRTPTSTPTSTPSGAFCSGPMGGANPGALPNDTIGLYDPPDSFFYLKNSNSAGAQDFLFQFGPPPSSLKPISGDWINQGKTTVGLFDPGTSTFYLKLHNSGGVADFAYQFTPVVTGRIPLTGDWIGTGVKDGGEYDSTTGTFYLRNSNSTGGADTTFVYGPGGTDLVPLAGDWFGLGHDTVGLYSLSNACFYLKHDNAAGTSSLDYQFQYGPGHGLGIPVVGHWVGGTQTSIGVYVPANAFWYLKNTNAAGNADTQFQYGPGPNSGWLPVIGHWGAPGTGITPPTDVPTRINGSVGFVSNRNGQWGIYKLNGDDTHTTRLAVIGNNPVASRPAWSPDGKQVAFVSDKSGNPEIYVMNEDGTSIQRLTYTKALNYQPIWSPDGKRIAFVSNRDNTINLYVMDASGGNIQQLTHGIGVSSEQPAWSPDGNAIAYATGTGTLNIAVMNQSGSKTQLLTQNGRQPTWSPDGKQIAFASTRNGNSQIYVMNADGSNVQRLTNSKAQEEMPTWSPDGKQIAFVSTRNGNSQIYVMNADGSNVQRLTNSLGQDQLPVWLK